MKITIVTGLLVPLVVLTMTLTEVIAGCNQELVDAFNQFSLALYRDLKSDDPNGNLLFSPYSIASGFLMVLLGSDGKTADSIAEVLQISPAIRDRVQTYRKCIEGSIHRSKAVKLYTANRIYPATSLNIPLQFIDSIKLYYGSNSAVHPINFKDTERSLRIINEWIADATNNHVKNVVQPGNISPTTLIVIVNAIYFKGAWKYKFPIGDTHKANFFIDKDSPVEVDMMVKETYFGYTNSPPSILDAQIVELPYHGDDVSMIILLPNSRFGLTELEQKLTLDILNSELKYLRHYTNITITLPKFRLNQRYVLNDNLKRLGMDRVFSEADFSNMAYDKGVTINEAIHEAFIEVNEEGTEAKAATVLLGARTQPSPPVRVTCDHPFLFFIRDIPTGAILFWGRFTKPEQNNKGSPRQPTSVPKNRTSGTGADTGVDPSMMCMSLCNERRKSRKVGKPQRRMTRKYKMCMRKCNESDKN